MAPSQNSTRHRLIQTAVALFASQGVTATTTKQIAESAGVNEVTLFRHFGSKHGLLLAVIEETAIFTQLGQRLISRAEQTDNIYEALKDYANACLQAFDRVPEVVRSVVGEAGNFPAENREALGRGFTQANHNVAAYFETVINRGQLHTYLPAEKLASLLNGMLLGYAVIEFTSEFHNLWQDRDDFLENLVTLFLHGAVSSTTVASSTISSTTVASTTVASATVASSTVFPFTPASTTSALASAPNHSSLPPPTEPPEKIADLPARLVHLILQRTKKLGAREYALAYVLFGAGLSPTEIVRLEQVNYINDANQQLLQIRHGHIRQVPINQWIMGKRYGSYTRNPLTQWLKSRKDQHPALFLNLQGNPLTEAELQQQWQEWVEGLQSPETQPIAIKQAQQTWCIEMLSKGIALENLCILLGWNAVDLQPYVDRAREKAALEQAMRLDQKP